jgi:hypothetical protein
MKIFQAYSKVTFGANKKFGSRLFPKSLPEMRTFPAGCWTSLLALLVIATMSGCGGGGYIGGGIQSLSQQSATIDASQSISIKATVTQGINPTWAITGANCSGSGCGSLSATSGTTITYIAPPTLTAPIHVQLLASVPGTSSSSSAAITVNPAPVISGNPPPGVVGVAYSSTVTVTGGTAPTSLSLSAGALPAGLSFNASTGVISGTPLNQGNYTVVLSATDSSNIPYTVTAQDSIPVTATAGSGTLFIAGAPPAGTVGSAYSTALIASGGTAPYTWNIVSGVLPTGLALNAATGVISGMPTTQGTFTFTARAQDSGGKTGAATFAIAITAAGSSLTLANGMLPNGTVGIPYAATVSVTGGTSPYSCAVTGGALPTGLALASNCQVSGTPSMAGTTTVMVKATDSSNPAQTITGPQTITIVPPPLSLTTGMLPNGTVGQPYSSTIGVAGGTSPYSCAIVSGVLPAGLALGANCLVSGTPSVAGTATVSVKATDAGNPAQTTTGQESITISPAPLTLTPGGLPNGTVGTPYMSTIGVSGGTSPYSCAITSGSLPLGLALGANCLVSGTPSAAGTSTLGIRATDSGNPAQTANGPETITINPAGATLAISSPPAATAGTPYTGTVPVSGGTGPYTCALTSGTLPANLSLGNNCVITGTPVTAGMTTVTVKGTDSSQPANSNSGPVTITVNSGATLTVSSPPDPVVGTPYTGTIPITGGTAPYQCVLASGTLPAGLTLNTNCTVTGTPTTPGPVTVMITTTDSGNPPINKTGPVTITVDPLPKLTFTGSLPNATLGVFYTQTLHATGGTAPYTYTLTAGTLPPGIALSSSGVVSGTPTAVGASSFTVTATDSESTPQTASLPLVLLVVYPTTANDSLLNGPYAFLFQGYDDVVAGVLAYQTATAGSFTADGTGAITAGEQDSNHQASTPAGATVATQTLLGTYTIGTDDRGSLTVTTFNTDGSVNNTTTYAISVHAPVASATTSASGSLIEFDNNNLVGTRGSGTFLAQQASAITTGLTGSYVFGLSGDTPCLPACTIGVLAGPAASVGQFTTSGGAISSGIGDLNIASTNLPSRSLAGSYSSADSNGRVQLAMTTSGTVAGVYPQDYAVYIVDAGHAFVLSTDKHSAYILLAGSAQAQVTPGAYTGTSLSGPYVGYENSPTNPGLAGVALQNVLNLSTATIFRGTGDGAGNCTTTNVDQAGTTGLANGLTGLGSGLPILNALLGTYQSLGNSTCAIAASGRAVLMYPEPNTVLSTALFALGLPTTPPPARVVYLASPNQGYFLETGYAGLGNIEKQVGSPFTIATLDGTYVYGTAPAASAASLNASGVFTANGAGSATTTLDRNVGVGNINLLQLGVTGTSNYTLTDPAAGRYVLGGSTIIYAITPTRFVLVDASALTTSPSIALVY